MKAPTLTPMPLALERGEIFGKRPPVPRKAARNVSSGMPSTKASRRSSVSRCSSRHGASVRPQLPMTTVVTPCHGDGLSLRVPEELAVVVGVQVDEARGHDQTAGVDLAAPRPCTTVPIDDPSPGDATSARTGSPPSPSQTSLHESPDRPSGRLYPSRRRVGKDQPPEATEAAPRAFESTGSVWTYGLRIDPTAPPA